MPVAVGDGGRHRGRRSSCATVQAHGPDAVAGLTSARCTNEDNYLFQKLMRVGIGTNNIDHCARLCHSSTVTGLVTAFGSGAMTNSIREIRHADCILITGSNTAESHPVISYEVIRAVKGGANLIILDPRRVPLTRHATLYLQAQPGTDIYVFLAMAHVILREGWADTGVPERSAWRASRPSAPAWPSTRPRRPAWRPGVPAEQIERRPGCMPWASAPSAPRRSASPRGHSTILYAMGITQRSIGTQLVQMLANLAMLTGQVGKPSTGVNPLRGQSNVQGACDVGGLPEYLPGYQPRGRRRQAPAGGRRPGAWRTCRPGTGLTVVEMMHAAGEGKVRAMYVMGENPMMSDPDLQHVEKSLRNLDFLVVQDIFFNETAQLAHVILPAAAALEKDGTMTNTERRVQLLRPVVRPPGEARPDWFILAEIGAQLDRKRGLDREVEFWEFATPADVMEEIATVTPIYRGVRHHRLRQAGLAWPVPDARHPGTPTLHLGGFTRGKGQMTVVGAQLPAEQPDAEYPLILSTGRTLYHYHSGTMTRRSEGLSWREPRSYAEINEADADELGIRDAGPIVILSRRGQVRTQARVGQRVPQGNRLPVLPLAGGAGQSADARLRPRPAGQDPGVQGVRRARRGSQARPRLTAVGLPRDGWLCQPSLLFRQDDRRRRQGANWPLCCGRSVWDDSRVGVRDGSKTWTAERPRRTGSSTSKPGRMSAPR